MTELASCPFCGAEMLVVEDGIEHPASDTCPMDCLWLPTDHITAWNTRALPSATQAGGENQALRAMIRVNMLRYGPADLTHEDIDRQIEAAIAAFTPLPPAPEASAQREEARKG